ncbi:MAG: cadherin domain-containing protein [Chryseolinea sp.]
MTIRLSLSGIILLLALNAFAQTPGLIFKTAGTGTSVLDPNADGYTSSTTSGFTINDQSQSEILYKPLVVPAMEPTADPGPGPDCSFNDIVDSGSEDPVFSYYDGTNLLFRFRLGGAAPNSKGYSILIDTDQRFGSSGVNADANAVSGNPGFEMEIVLRTNFDVSLYSVDGTTTPVLKTSFAFANYAQKSIALTTNCSNPDYFYDFYIPFSAITTFFPSVTASTPLRMVAVTSMNPAAAIGNNAVSDVGGLDDAAYGNNYDNIFSTIIDNFYPTPVTGINGGFPADRTPCPSITSSVSTSSAGISGTSTQATGTVIKVYKNGTLLNSTAVTVSGTWTLAVSGLVSGDVVTASATATGKTESVTNCTTITVATSCSANPTGVTGSINKNFEGSGVVGAIIKVYKNGVLISANPVASATVSASGTFCWKNNGQSSCNAGSSGQIPEAGVYRITQTESGKCESPGIYVCLGGTILSATPSITTSPILTTTTSVSGTSSSTAFVMLYADNAEIGSTTATAGGGWTVAVSGLTFGASITAKAIENGLCVSSTSTASTVKSISAAPVIIGSYCTATTITAISGTTTEASGTLIELFSGANSLGTTTSNATGAWTKANLAISPGAVITAKATSTSKLVSAASNSVTIGTLTSNGGLAVTSPIVEGATSITGVVSGTPSVKVYIDQSLLGTAVVTGGTWAITVSASDIYAGGSVTATVMESGNCESSHSTGVNVSCLLPSISRTVSPASTSICSGATTSVTITAAESGIIYQFYNGATATGPSKLGNGSDLVLTSSALTSSATLTIKALKISGVSCTADLTAQHAVTIVPVINNNTITAPTTATFCNSGNPDPIIGSLPTGGTGTFNYQWQSSTSNITYTDISSAVSQDFDPGLLPQTTYFKRLVTSGPCQTTTSTPVLITIQGVSITNTISSSVSTSFTNTGIPSMDGNAAGGGVTYAWQSSADNITFANTGITIEDYTPGSSITNTTHFRRITSNGSCAVISNVITYSVNNAPTVANFSKGGTEDMNVNFTSADFTSVYTDGNGDALTQIRIESISVNGALFSGAAALTAGSVVLLADLGNIVFSPNSNYNGSTSFTWKANDGSAYSATASTVTLAIAAANDPPVGSNASVAALEDITYTFTTSDFSSGFTDPDADAFAGIRITGLETAGALKLNGADVNLNDVVSAASLSSSLFTFVPTTNANSAGYATFPFEVFDGTTNSATSYTLTVNLTAVNDSPSFTKGADQTHATNAGAISANGWAASISKGPADESAQTLNFVVTNDNNGLFSVQPDVDEVTGNLTYIIAAGINGTASVNVQLTDNGGLVNGGSNTSSIQNFTINVNGAGNTPPVANDATVSINENAANGTAVHTIVATDANLDILTYSIIAGNASSAFAISSTTGAITVANVSQLNFETITQFVLTVRVSDGSSSNNATITINLNNLNDNSPVSNDATASINENSTNGTAVHTVAATDADNNTLSYTIISGNTTGAFAISSTTGAITVADVTKIDFETTTQFTVTVRVSDGTNLDDAIITINLNDLNDNSPVAIDAIVSINENSTNGTAVHTVAATDADNNTLSYAIISGNTTGVFAISSTTGTITVADVTKLDFESTTQFILTVRVSDGTNPDDATITINLNNLNDNGPVANDATVAINENSTNGTVVYTVSATDADNNTLSYTIIAGNTTGAFAISSITGAITVADIAKLDFEAVPQFVLTVRVSDGTNDRDISITINLNDLSDNTAPVANNATVSINENISNGTSVHTVIATDTESNPLSYFITAGNATGAFAISATTGVITVADITKLDFETTAQFILTVQVSDGTNTDDATITISLNNLNDNSPIASDAILSINENTANGTAVHTVGAVDADGNSLSYSITAGNITGAFVINPSTGAITTADITKLDFETTNQFNLTVSVSDGTNSDDASIIINLNNLNDNTPVSNDATVSINENSTNGTVVHTVVASDLDGSTLTYTITGGNGSGAFIINPSTGVITVNDQTILDYETVNQFTLTILISDGTNTKTVSITINLNNLADVASAATSTIIANPTSILANGASTSSITIQLKDASGTNLTSSGGIVTLATTSGSISTVTDHNNGTYTAALTSANTAGAALITGVINGTSITDNETVNFVVAVASVSTSVITSSSTAITANGTATTTITIRLKDINGNNIITGGNLVTLATTLGTLTSVIDHGDGTYTATLISATTTGTATITGTIDGVATIDQETVTFNPGPSSGLTTTISTSETSISANVTSTSIITVQLRDANNNLIVSGNAAVALSTTLGTLSSIINNGDGTYTATLTASATAGTAIVSGTVDTAQITDTATVDITVVPLILSGTISSNTPEIPADGVSSAVITVTVKDQNNNPVSNASVTFTTSAGTLSQAVNNNDGTYTTVLTSNTAESTAIVAFVINNISASNTISVAFISLPATALFIPEGFSPDGDGVNDTFTIEGADDYVVTLKVFNRWGNEVYEAKAYKNDWEGRANRGVVLGEKLPDGTYFYAIDLNNGSKPYVRYMTLKRK